jgi:hypothetical protein
MKRLLPLFCILVVLFAPASTVSANSSQPDQFTITGITTGVQTRPLPNGQMGFNLIAAGESDGYLQGPFTFKEWGSVDPNTGRGVNTGLLTINRKNDPKSQATIWFGGQTDSQSVWGAWHVIEGKGAWKQGFQM